jgi:hypothetical protein
MSDQQNLKDRLEDLNKKYESKKNEDFEALYLVYWRYIYKYEVGYEEDFNPDKPTYKRDDFRQQLKDEGMAIKVNEGY